LRVHDAETDSIEKMFKIIVDSIDYVFDAENVYKGKETAKPEMVKFVEAMHEKAFDEIKEFFGNLAALKHKVDYKCTKCGHKEPVTLEGLEDFFGFA
jgi:rubrerythrin